MIASTPKRLAVPFSGRFHFISLPVSASPFDIFASPCTVDHVSTHSLALRVVHLLVLLRPDQVSLMRASLLWSQLQYLPHKPVRHRPQPVGPLQVLPKPPEFQSKRSVPFTPGERVCTPPPYSAAPGKVPIPPLRRRRRRQLRKPQISPSHGAVKSHSSPRQRPQRRVEKHSPKSGQIPIFQAHPPTSPAGPGAFAVLDTGDPPIPNPVVCENQVSRPSPFPPSPEPDPAQEAVPFFESLPSPSDWTLRDHFAAYQPDCSDQQRSYLKQPSPPASPKPQISPAAGFSSIHLTEPELQDYRTHAFYSPLPDPEVSCIPAENLPGVEYPGLINLEGTPLSASSSSQRTYTRITQQASPDNQAYTQPDSVSCQTSLWDPSPTFGDLEGPFCPVPTPSQQVSCSGSGSLAGTQSHITNPKHCSTEAKLSKSTPSTAAAGVSVDRGAFEGTITQIPTPTFRFQKPYRACFPTGDLEGDHCPHSWVYLPPKSPHATHPITAYPSQRYPNIPPSGRGGHQPRPVISSWLPTQQSHDVDFSVLSPQYSFDFDFSTFPIDPLNSDWALLQSYRDT